MVYQSPDAFLTAITTMYKTATTAQVGSVIVTYKRYTPHADAQVRELKASTRRQMKGGAANKQQHGSKKKSSDTTTTPSSTHTPPTPAQIHPIHHVQPTDEPVCLIHARYGPKKISTTVRPTEVKAFTRGLSAIMTVHNKLLEAGEAKPPKHVPERKKRKKSTTAAASASTATTSTTTEKPANAVNESGKKSKV